jgi:hypothetical protein
MTTESKENQRIMPIGNRWLPGHSGNPAGRPKKTYADLASALPEDLKLQHVMAQSDRALAGDTRAFEALRDTAEGRPTQRMEVTDTSVADALRAEVLAALANAGAISYVDAEYTELT